MSRQHSSTRTWSLCTHVLRTGLICAAILAAGGAVYAQAPQQDNPSSVGRGYSQGEPSLTAGPSDAQGAQPLSTNEPTPDTLTASLLPRDLSAWGMFLTPTG